MNKIILLLVSFLAIVSTSAKDTSTVNSFLGKWKSFEDEIISIEYNNKSNEVSFSRSFNNEIVSEGIIIVENCFLAVTRKDTLLSYKLKYAFSPDGETLVVMKPNSRQAWLLYRTSYY